MPAKLIKRKYGECSLIKFVGYLLDNSSGTFWEERELSKDFSTELASNFKAP